MPGHSIIPFEGDLVSSISDFVQKMWQDPVTLLILGTITFAAILFLSEYSSWGRIQKKT
ncbi:MAG: hypothetical protein ACRD38_05310 [Nitrososphaerales archaeon]